MSNHFNLNDKKVVIIGGSSGIGFSTALLAKELGAKTIIAGRNLEKLERAQPKLNADIYQLDNQDDEQLKDFFSKIGCFDHLFTPAASYEIGSITADKSVAESCFKGKFWTQYMAVKLARPYINEKGSIVLMSGAASQRLPKGFNVAMYVACNAAIEGLVRGLAYELPPIRINAVAPGTTVTPLWESRDPALRESAYQIYRDHCLLEQVGNANDIAQAVIYLMVNEFTTGSVLYPDGGFTLK